MSSPPSSATPGSSSTGTSSRGRRFVIRGGRGRGRPRALYRRSAADDDRIRRFVRRRVAETIHPFPTAAPPARRRRIDPVPVVGTPHARSSSLDEELRRVRARRSPSSEVRTPFLPPLAHTTPGGHHYTPASRARVAASTSSFADSVSRASAPRGSSLFPPPLPALPPVPVPPPAPAPARIYGPVDRRPLWRSMMPQRRVGVAPRELYTPSGPSPTTASMLAWLRARNSSFDRYRLMIDGEFGQDPVRYQGDPPYIWESPVPTSQSTALPSYLRFFAKTPVLHPVERHDFVALHDLCMAFRARFGFNLLVQRHDIGSLYSPGGAAFLVAGYSD